ncbi:hypothetical protein MPH61_05700 [Peribacillus muralis]|uniref:hypothetical protein n=1 Tax=Peribacillus muralis TaxID=264697 RepID=UPI001F4D40F4|nr:hypothetical protein [Peribacillus muralis]MCK1992091.1 hypothetical protein [Peribacillus muralis]MCK2012647.1 hypothetical protein [Peribacillus muralis]
MNEKVCRECTFLYKLFFFAYKGVILAVIPTSSRFSRFSTKNRPFAAKTRPVTRKSTVWRNNSTVWRDNPTIRHNNPSEGNWWLILHALW